ncbi:hypothetical protein V1511DRAFT_8056 [Dipodascopsis uninucleata]
MVATVKIKEALLKRLREADFESATLKSIRTQVVKDLGLPAEFFKQEKWRKLSNELADQVVNEEDHASEKNSSQKPKNEIKEGNPEATDDLNIDSSDYSDVIDEIPAPRQKRKLVGVDSSSSKKSKAPAASMSTKKTTVKKKNLKSNISISSQVSSDPFEEKISTLKTWIVRCGERKQWSRELASYPTAKEKIARLQKILEDLGMTPRYSMEKAKRIKEERDLAREVAQLRESVPENIRSRRSSSSSATSSGAIGNEDESVYRSKSNSKVVAGGLDIGFLGDQSDSD